jgi:hypothetical protein
LAAWWGLRGSDKIANGLLFEPNPNKTTSGPANFGYNVLRQNEGQGIHSYTCRTLNYQVTCRRYWQIPSLIFTQQSESVKSIAV